MKRTPSRVVYVTCLMIISVFLYPFAGKIGLLRPVLALDARETQGKKEQAPGVTGVLDLFLRGSAGKKSQDQTEGASKEQSGADAERQKKTQGLVSGIVSILSSAAEIDYDSERTIGESLALEAFHRYGMPVKDQAFQEYVNLVGAAVARNGMRPSIPYRFVVVDSPLQNAFSCPGGIIFVSLGLIKTIKSEGQLACLLAHEVAHVGHKHALQAIKRARFFEGVGKITASQMEGEKGRQFEDMIGNLQTVLFDRGLDQNMEFEADLTAMNTAYKTGYDPRGMIEVLEELKKIEATSDKAGSWFSTHPPLGQRLARCAESLGKYPDAEKMARLPDRFRVYQERVL